MPLPTGKDTADTEYLQRLYDDYCKIALQSELTPKPAGLVRYVPSTNPEDIAERVHAIATAMLNERKK